MAPGLERGDDLALHAVGKVRRVDQAERERREELFLLAALVVRRTRGDEFHSVKTTR
jgi:hypothetical protein